MRLVLTALLVLQACSTTDQRAAEPITVCEAFRVPGGYQDKTVKLTGVYFYGGLLTPGCSHTLEYAGMTWKPIVGLEYVGGSDGEQPFVTDRSSWDELHLALLAAARTGRKAEVQVTAEGILRGPYAENGAGIRGFGHLGVYCMELAVRRISDVRTLDRPTFDYETMVRPPPRE